MYERPIVFKEGLVDPTSLLEFMDGCHCQDLHTPNVPGSHAVEHHHLYFPLKKFKNVEAPLSVRMLRNSKYNQVEMLSCQEDLYHQKSALVVPRDQIDLEAANTFLEEAEWLTNYAATSWLIAETKDELNHSRMLQSEKNLLAARLAVLSEMQEAGAEQVGRIELMESSLVTGALSSYLGQRPELGLQSLVESRKVDGEGIMYTRIYEEPALRTIAEFMLSKRPNPGMTALQSIVAAPAVEAA